VAEDCTQAIAGDAFTHPIHLLLQRLMVAFIYPVRDY
jgi:hypothetical protein